MMMTISVIMMMTMVVNMMMANGCDDYDVNK